MTEKTDHGREAAKAAYDHIVELLAAYDKADEEGDHDAMDEARREIDESILEVTVRSGWHAVGSDLEPQEFAILITTGGPAVRIRGKLDRWNQPMDCCIEYQNWFTPWTELHEEGVLPSVIERFAGFFYFGE